MANTPKYKSSFADKLPDMFANGESVEEVCRELKISRRAFYDWVEKHPDFAEAYELGKEASQAWWLKLGRAGAAGKVPVQPSIWIFNMKNRLGWKDRVETSSDEQPQPLSITFEVREPVGTVKVTNAKPE